MKEKFVLFGAGLNGCAAIDYYGRENIVAIIDNASSKVGSFINNIPVISLNEYKKKYYGYLIIICVCSGHYFSCKQQLIDENIYNFFTSPTIVYGFQEPEKIVDYLAQKNHKRICLYGVNPISLRMAHYAKSIFPQLDVSFVRSKYAKDYAKDMSEWKAISIKDVDEKYIFVNTINWAEEEVKKIQEIINCHAFMDIYDINYKSYEINNELTKYNNLYQGKRCFVIGNGPSLKADDLSLLYKNNELTFAANGIYHIFEQTCWRPTYYVLSDYDGLESALNAMKYIEPKSCFLPKWNRLPEPSNVLDESNRYRILFNIYMPDSYFDFSNDIAVGIYNARTVTYTMLQLACYMGFKAIYLLGVDWTGGKGTGIRRRDFYENEEVSCVGEYDSILEEERAYKSAKYYAEKNGVKIYNATRGGELEVFERVNFDELFH